MDSQSSPLTAAEIAGIPDLHLIWSFEHDAWWGPDECGYHAAWHVSEAGRYSAEDATRICEGANRHRPKNNPNEIAVKLTSAAYELEALLADRSRLVEELERVRQENEGFRSALTEIANPIAAMRTRAEAEGATLHGDYAVALAKDGAYLQSIARSILASQEPEQ